MHSKTEIKQRQLLDGSAPAPFGVFLSVIIPTHHRARSIGICLERLADGAQSLDQSHYEVIVSDDGDNAETQNLIAEKFPWVRWVKSEEKGQGNRTLAA
jgi:glycosyltransferase involved in cell wall biosynthesis